MSRFGPDPLAFFEAVYEDPAPWDIGAPQPAMVALLVAAFNEKEDVLEGETRAFDDAVLRWIHAHAPPWTESVALEVTRLGETLVLTLLTAVCALLLRLAAGRFAAWLMVAAFAGGAILMALITGTPMQALFVLIGYVVIQIVDNNFLVPKIVASKVKVNALISIVVVLLWGALWGVAGMFLSIPITAIIKVIFDRVKSLKPYGFLLGDTMPPIGKKIFRISVMHPKEPAARARPRHRPGL